MESGGKLWGCRFGDQPIDPVMERFNSSINYDKRLCYVDILGSKAYATALFKAGLLDQVECADICHGLASIEDEWRSATFRINPSDEDVHSANERRLKELIGSAGGKLHTGRSRNDQVATDLRLWLRQEIDESLDGFLVQIIQVLIERAQDEMDILLPGYTHLQRAQPIRWSHYLCSYAWSLWSDWNRLMQLRDRVNVMPLGSGALAGNPFPIDRHYLSDLLGFDSITPNSLLGVSDRDFVVEFLSWASILSSHLSRLAEDLIIYSTKEFNFVTIADAYSTGSSLMPQKRNPDGLELIRAKAGRIFGQMAGFSMVLKGLPSAYNKDLQEDKEALFDVVDNLFCTLQVAAGILSTLKVNGEKTLGALSSDMLATDLAYHLVPFRDAHVTVGKIVAMAETQHKDIAALTLEDLQSISSVFDDPSVTNIWNYEHSVEQYQVTGGTSRRAVQKQIDDLKALLEFRKGSISTAL
ncbi:argininosuccinate lyase-like isoform X2 [Daphnia carinata]|uniref:argininosuccinate lyase-like isoform X2 n=1 Tax=Daphnia carinata TaxID=120202 RepID=UPI00257E369E|nr:argininosuccinate lyase-like isoform X2 [Daphnia carinata]